MTTRQRWAYSLSIATGERDKRRFTATPDCHILGGAGIDILKATANATLLSIARRSIFIERWYCSLRRWPNTAHLLLPAEAWLKRRRSRDSALDVIKNAGVYILSMAYLFSAIYRWCNMIFFPPFGRIRRRILQSSTVHHRVYEFVSSSVCMIIRHKWYKDFNISSDISRRLKDGEPRIISPNPFHDTTCAKHYHFYTRNSGFYRTCLPGWSGSRRRNYSDDDGDVCGNDAIPLQRATGSIGHIKARSMDGQKRDTSMTTY